MLNVELIFEMYLPDSFIYGRQNTLAGSQMVKYYVLILLDLKLCDIVQISGDA